MEFSQSQKGNQVLTYKGFQYLRFRTRDETVTWRCRESRSTKCPAFLKTTNDCIEKEPTSHSHDSCPQKAQANIFRSKMREDIAQVSATPRNVIGNTLQHATDDVLAYIPKQSSLARSLLRHKSDKHLPNPSTTQFEIPTKYVDFILYDSGVQHPDRILVLGNQDLLQKLNQDTIFGDGTFDKAPKMFYQLYTWHAKIGNSFPPCVYILLQKKNEATYSEMFRILKDLVPNMAPQKILLDFERACINAAKSTFPDAEVKGCYFHLSQSLIRKIHAVGLKIAFESNVDTKLMLKSLAALAFVPPEEVRDVFDQLAATFPDEDGFNDVLTYFFSTYIEGAAGRNPQFPLNTWNHYEAALDQSPRTTNCCEGFHNALNSIFHCSHPSIWNLFEGLQRDMACHRLTWANAQQNRSEPTKRKYRQLYATVASTVAQYQATEDKLQFLRRLANLQ